MSMKKLLGLEGSSISDAEIAARFAEAFRNDRRELVFSRPSGNVTVHLRGIERAGIMREYRDYYAK